MTFIDILPISLGEISTFHDWLFHINTVLSLSLSLYGLYIFFIDVGNVFEMSDTTHEMERNRVLSIILQITTIITFLLQPTVAILILSLL